MEQTQKEKSIALEKGFQELFANAISTSGEEEMLSIASRFSRQISGKQLKLILYLQYRASKMNQENRIIMNNFITKWLELKQYNNSASFVMRALESISLRKFINENSVKVDIQK